MTRETDHVVITGCGWVTPFAAGNIAQVLAAAAPAAPPPGDHWPIPDDLLQAVSGVSDECRQDRGSHLAAAGLELARRDAALLPESAIPGDRVGMVLGCALAGQSGMIDFANDVREQSARFVSPIRFPQTVGNYIAGALARGYDIRGPNSTLASGVASGLDAVVEARALLFANRADIVYAGGVDRLTSQLATGLAQPGVTLSDGACWFVLEREGDARRRGAPILAIIDDHIVKPAFHSVAGMEEPGALRIEVSIGRCLGTLGAAALAAGLGAALGHTLPASAKPSAAGTEFLVHAVDTGHRTTVGVRIVR